MKVTCQLVELNLFKWLRPTCFKSETGTAQLCWEVRQDAAVHHVVGFVPSCQGKKVRVAHHCHFSTLAPPAIRCVSHMITEHHVLPFLFLVKETQNLHFHNFPVVGPLYIWTSQANTGLLYRKRVCGLHVQSLYTENPSGRKGGRKATTINCLLNLSAHSPLNLEFCHFRHVPEPSRAGHMLFSILQANLGELPRVVGWTLCTRHENGIMVTKYVLGTYAPTPEMSPWTFIAASFLITPKWKLPGNSSWADG